MYCSEEDKERIIKQFLPKIKHYAIRYHHPVYSFLEVEDLISAGIKGLLEALNKYNPALNVPLGAFIDYRIRGAILDEIRSVDVFSKEFRRKVESVKKAYKDLKNSGYEPSDEEIANSLNISIEQLQEVYQGITASDILSLDEHILSKEGDKLNILDILSDEKNFFEEIKNKEIYKKLSLAIDSLSEKEKLIVNLYYYEELNMREISEILGVSLSRVSQLHGKALLKIKNLLEKEIKDI
jgi:RNA polymerase sigma factor for flagellar operon FliA